MTSTVTSRTGRRWLKKQQQTQLSQAPLEAAGEDVVGAPTLGTPESQPDVISISGRLPLENKTVETAIEETDAGPQQTAAVDGKTKPPRFATEGIYNQLHGTDGVPAVGALDVLEVENMHSGANSLLNESVAAATQDSDYQIVYVNVPNVTVSDSEHEVNSMRSHAGSESVPVQADVESVGAEADSVISADRETGNEPVSAQVDQISMLVDSLFKRFPLAAPTALLFVGSEENSQVDTTCAKIASAIASRNVGDVLLLDADVNGRQLTVASGLQEQDGYAECINLNQSWQSRVVSQNRSSFKFLPAGKCGVDRWNAKELLRNAVAEMKAEYQFICVAAGNTRTKQAKLWFDICDATYLVVSLKSSNESIAQAAVEELKGNGARVLGCVVTDADYSPDEADKAR